MLLRELFAPRLVFSPDEPGAGAAAGAEGEHDPGALLSAEDQDDIMGELSLDIIPLDEEEESVEVAGDGDDPPAGKDPAAGNEPPKDPAKPESAAPKPGAESKPQEQKPVQVPVSETPEFKAMQAQLTQLAEQNKALVAALTPRPQGGQDQPRQPQQPKQPERIEYSVPDKIVENLVADDPAVRKQAVEDLVQSVLQTTMREFNAGAEALMRDEIPQLVGRVQQQRQWSQKLHDDFYTLYPKLGEKPLVKQTVARATVEVVGEMTRSGARWDGQMSKPLARRIAEKTLDLLGLKAVSSAKPKAQAAPAVVTNPATARRVVANGLDPNSPAGIMDIIGD